MVERLKLAIAKARERRTGAEGGTRLPRAEPTRREPEGAVAAAWAALPELEIDPLRLEAERIVTRQKSDAAHIAFDMLRTRLSKLALEQGWRRIGITSPSKGCGKTVISGNLGFSFARHPETRAILVDLDLRSPRLSATLGPREERPISRLLMGEVQAAGHLKRLAPRFAVALNSQRVRDSAELIQHQATAEAMQRMIATFDPHIVIYDMPPMLVGDDTIAFLRCLDAVILVIAAGETKPYEVEECEALITEETNFLGVLLNKVERGSGSDYYYGYGYGYGERDR